MGSQAEVLRVVLDTNAVVSALVFDRGTMVWLRRAWQRLLFTPLINQRCARELVRVLGYPKLGLGEQEVRDLLSDYLPYAEVVASRGSGHLIEELFGMCRRVGRPQILRHGRLE